MIDDIHVTNTRGEDRQFPCDNFHVTLDIYTDVHKQSKVS